MENRDTVLVAEMFRSHSQPFVSKLDEPCKACGCVCHVCLSNVSNSLDLHKEIEELNSKLVKANNRTSQLEMELVTSHEFSHGEMSKLQDELARLRDRYDRLYESHRKLQKLNHNLEDKLLSLVTVFNTERDVLEKDVVSLNSRLLEAKLNVCDLEEECERYRSDCNTAVQLLQCKPSEFVAHKLNTLPLDIQERVKSHLSQQQIVDLEDSVNHSPEAKTIHVAMPTFPPTAMMYSMNSVSSTDSDHPPPKVDTVPTDIITKVLTQPRTGRKPRLIYICSKCHQDVTYNDEQTQTDPLEGVHGSDEFSFSFSSRANIHRTHSAGTTLLNWRHSSRDGCVSSSRDGCVSSSLLRTHNVSPVVHQPGVHRARMNSDTDL